MSDNEDEKSEVIEKRHEHVLPGEHVYEGVLFFGYTPPDILDAVKDFEVRDSDIFLSTFPKAGTTWLQELTWLIMNDGNFDEAIQKPVYFRSPFLEFKDEVLNEVGLDLANQMPSPRVIKSHLPVKLIPRQIKSRDCKTIVLFRNPKDLCVSYYHFYRASSSFGDFRGTWEDFFYMFLDGHVDHGSWFDYTRSWWARRQDPRICILYFEDMKSDLRREIDRLCDFLEKPLQEGVRDAITGHCLFDSMRSNPMTNHLDVYSINAEVSPLLRKGEVGDWKNLFTVTQSELFDKFFKDELGDLNIPFKFTLD
ncbi:sulfotransferase 1C4-like [Mya arenaria]|uniref:sulfotransferase 1C4-like n=1 Tax=Mya arenaria TaxID=6604 RepID=UPI0022DFDC53|nr:sulfotransferase 1C4-like [Mya arenaria]